MKLKVTIKMDGKNSFTYFCDGQTGTSLNVLMSEIQVPRFWSKYPTQYNPVGYDGDIRLSHIVANAYKLGIPATDLLYRMIDHYHTTIKTHQFDVSECTMELAGQELRKYVLDKDI